MRLEVLLVGSLVFLPSCAVGSTACDREAAQCLEALGRMMA